MRYQHYWLPIAIKDFPVLTIYQGIFIQIPVALLGEVHGLPAGISFFFHWGPISLSVQVGLRWYVGKIWYIVASDDMTNIEI